MKTVKLSFLIFFYLFCKYTYGESKTVICGKIKSSERFIVHIYEPVYGFYNTAFLDTTSLNSSLVNGRDSIYKMINLGKPAFIKVYFTTMKKEFITRSDILLFPGDSLHLDIDLNHDTPGSIVYKGDNAMGQRLFNEINFEPYYKFIPVFDALDKIPENSELFVQKIKNIELEIHSRFDSLQKTAFITKPFVEFMDLCFKASLYNQVVTSLLRKSTKSEHIDRKEKDTIITELFKDMPPTDERLKTLYATELYLNSYYDYLSYQKYNFKNINELKSKKVNYHINGQYYLIDENLVPFIYIENKKDQEDLWALRLLLFYNYPGKFDFSFIEQYESIFSNNKWSSLLRKKFESMAIPRKITYKLQSPIQFIDTRGIATLTDLLSKLPDNPVFIDIWATWCLPCISAFGFNYQLDSFLIRNNIQRLYISLDDESNIEKWKQAINTYALGGYHLLANELLKKDIKQTVYHVKGNEGMGIPRYLLVSDGKIITDDAASPTEFELLKKQIRMNLLKIIKEDK